MAGIVGPVLFSAGFLAQQAFRGTAFDPIAKPVSALEAGPYGWIQQVNFVVFGLLLLGFTVGLHRGIDHSRWGVSARCCSESPRPDSSSQPRSRSARTRPGRSTTRAAISSPVSRSSSAPRSLCWCSPDGWPRTRIPDLATYTAICGGLALIGFVVMARFAMPDDAPLHDVAGLIQRVVLLAVTFPCLVILAVRLRSKAS